MEQSKEHRESTLDALCDQLASDYAEYLHVDVSKQVSPHTPVLVDSWRQICLNILIF